MARSSGGRSRLLAEPMTAAAEAWGNAVPAWRSRWPWQLAHLPGCDALGAGRERQLAALLGGSGPLTWVGQEVQAVQAMCSHHQKLLPVRLCVCAGTQAPVQWLEGWRAVLAGACARAQPQLQFKC